MDYRDKCRPTATRKELYEKALKTLAQTEHLVSKTQLLSANHRLCDSSWSSNEDSTIDLNASPHKCNFYPSEMTGRSTECATADASISVEQILSESQCSNVRALADELKEFKIRESCGGEQLPRTADISITSVKSFQSSMSRPDDFGAAEEHCEIDPQIFVPSDRVKDFLEIEEKRFAEENATLSPSQVGANQSKGNVTRNALELPDFSRNLSGNQSACESNYSVGQFFIKRSCDVKEMLPNVSPNKAGRPLALLDSLNTTEDSAAEEREDHLTASRCQNDKNGISLASESLISMSTIESFFRKCDVANSPQTITNNLLRLKGAVASKNPPSVQHLPEIGLVTEPLPLKPQNSNINVNILKVEKFIGDVSALRCAQKNVGQLQKSTMLTPSGHHIKRNPAFYDKENDQSSLHSDTLSMSGILSSSSEIQENDFLNSKICESPGNDSALKVPETESQRVSVNSGNHETTPTKTSVRRKRTRSNDRTVTSTNSLNTTPENNGKHLGVTFNSKHRLYSPSEVKSIKHRGTIVDVLFNPKHRLPSPSTTPNKQQIEMQAPRPANSDLGNRSPKLLSQCNSQFGSVCDLREFSVKSSHSVISWPSQKLRTPSVKQFTIKNIGGKKLTMKIEVVGPGFQLSPSEPFQLIALQAQECRTVSVTFCPTIIGAAVGKLNFCHGKDSADRHARKIIPLFGYGGHTVLEVQGVSQGVVGAPFLQMGTTSDLLNMQLTGTFSIYNKGPLKGVSMIRVKSDTKKVTTGESAQIFTITPSKGVIGADANMQVEIVYRPRRNDVRKFMKQDGNVLSIATLEVFMADEPSCQRILGLINRFSTNSSDVYLLDDLFRGIPSNDDDDFKDFNESEDMIAELFNKMKSIEIVLTVKRSTLDHTLESEHDFFLSDSNESMFFHTLASDELLTPQIQSTYTSTSNTLPVASIRSNRLLARPAEEEWFVQPTEISLNPFNVDRSACKVEIHSNSLRRQIFEIDSNYPNMFVIEPECGVINPGSFTTVSITIRTDNLPSENLFVRIRVDKKREIKVPVVVH